MLYREIENCRICGNPQLDLILNLGKLSLTGIFPKSKSEEVPAGPLNLIKCNEESSKNSCGLVQLRESYKPELMYGQNYGYRSGLNNSMVQHLCSKVKKILDCVSLNPEDIVVDIGSNDSTLLRAYPNKKLSLVGFDPTGTKFKSFYPDHITLVADFFNSKSFKNIFGNNCNFNFT